MAAVSQKQYDVIMGLGNHHRTLGYWLERWLFLAGSIRSGKTYSSATGYVAWANNNFGGAQFIVAARLFRLIKANVRPQLERAAAELRIPSRWRTADSVLEIGSNEHWCFDGGNEASADKIQGITASGGYLDEAALMPKRFVEAVGERCSEPGAKVIATLNPREPNHWIITDYLEPAGYTVDGAGRIVVSGREADASRRVSGRHVGFSLADNPTLTAPYIQDLAATHSGTWLKRNVLGLWVAGEGLIWPRFTVCQAPAGPPDRWLVSIDAADRTVTHALLAGQWGPRIHIVDEWHHDAHRYGMISARSLAASAKPFATSTLNSAKVLVTSTLNSARAAVKVAPRTWRSSLVAMRSQPPGGSCCMRVSASSVPISSASVLNSEARCAWVVATSGPPVYSWVRLAGAVNGSDPARITGPATTIAPTSYNFNQLCLPTIQDGREG